VGVRVAQGEAAGSGNKGNAGESGEKGRKSWRSLHEVQVGIPEILVRGSRILNMDIKRSISDAQPYVIFDRDAIEKSGATNIEDFLKNRLPQNTVALTNRPESFIERKYEPD